MIHIDSQHDFSNPLILERAAKLTLEIADALQTSPKPDPVSDDISIVLTDDAQLHQLNRDFLGIDAPTDVLSFPSDEVDPETKTRYLGDIVISIPRAQQQADLGGHAVEEEAQLLVVHGVLHLLGHDHASAEEKARMWHEQAKVLERLGLSHIKIADQ